MVVNLLLTDRRLCSFAVISSYTGGRMFTTSYDNLKTMLVVSYDVC